MEDHLTGAPDGSALDRRRLLKRAAVGGAVVWAAPAIRSLDVAEAAVAAGSEAPGGGGGATTGTLSGRVVDASTGAAISGALVQITGGPATTTDASGNYTFAAAPSGTQEVTASAVDYAPQTQNVVVPNGGAATLNFALSALGTIAVVLQWNTLEDDLDLHMSGPDGPDDGDTARFHVAYYRRNPESHVSLDRDDTDGEGPETITITVHSGGGPSDYVPGEYRVWVHDFPLGSDGSDFHGAEAQVSFRDRTGSTTTFAPPPTDGTDAEARSLWRVFDFTLDADGNVTGTTLHQTYHTGSSSTVF